GGSKHGWLPMFPVRILALPGLGALASVAVLASAACSSSSSPAAAGGDAGTQDMAPTRPAETPLAPQLIGSGGFGYATGSGFPGATAPQGIAKLGPDTTGPWGNI